MINSFEKMKIGLKKGLNSDMNDAFEILGSPFICVVLGFIGVLILAVALDVGEAGGRALREPVPVIKDEITDKRELL